MTTVGFTLLTRMPYLPSSRADTLVTLSRAQRASGIDGDDLIEDGDVGFHRRDFAAEAAAVDDAPEVEPFESVTHFLFPGEVECKRAATGGLREGVERGLRATAGNDVGPRRDELADCCPADPTADTVTRMVSPSKAVLGPVLSVE